MIQHVERVTFADVGLDLRENLFARNFLIVPNAKRKPVADIRLWFANESHNIGLSTFVQAPSVMRIDRGMSAGRADGDCRKGNLPDSRVAFRVADDDGRRLPLAVQFVNHADASIQ